MRASLIIGLPCSASGSGGSGGSGARGTASPSHHRQDTAAPSRPLWYHAVGLFSPAVGILDLGGAGLADGLALLVQDLEPAALGIFRIQRLGPEWLVRVATVHPVAVKLLRDQVARMGGELWFGLDAWHVTVFDLHALRPL